MGDCFRQLAAAHSHLGVQLHVEELDILRGGKDHDLLDSSRQRDIIQSIRSGKWNLVLAAPPCNTFCRAVFSDRRHPNPIRCEQWPWGFPWLSPSDWDKAKVGNELLLFAIRCMEAVVQARVSNDAVHVHGWLEFPEDLGSAFLGEPASLWQLPEARALEGQVFHRGALFQCEWANLNYPKPTGIRTTINGVWPSNAFHQGWPTFAPGLDHSGNMVPRAYQGALPIRCQHKGLKGLKGRDTNGEFKTAPTGAYPPELCRAWATVMWNALVTATAAQDKSPNEAARAHENAVADPLLQNIASHIANGNAQQRRRTHNRSSSGARGRSLHPVWSSIVPGFTSF